MRRALFIVFEGIDGSGTTTQLGLLQGHVEADLGVSVISTREPGGTLLAERIRLLILDPEGDGMDSKTELLLYMASRANHVHELIRPSLSSGKPVFCDRFTASTLAYQGDGRGLDAAFIEQLNKFAIETCVPDFTIFLDLPVVVAQERQGWRGERRDRVEREGHHLQERAASAYRILAARRPEASLIVDARQSAERMALHIIEELHQRWPDFPFRS